MGTGPTRRKHGNSTSKKTMKRRGALQNRVKDVDQIQDELHRLKHGLPKALKAVVTYDEDLPGGGLNYCAECDRHFVTSKVLAEHKRTKAHKRRLRELAEKPYTHEEAEAAAGKSVASA